MKKMIGFGDYMLRLNPEGYLRFLQADRFQVNYTGAEANVCVSLAMMGMETAFVTRLPGNDIAACGVAQLRKFGVDTRHIVYGGDRMGVFYVEKGASQRPSKVVYDRKFSSIATCSLGVSNKVSIRSVSLTRKLSSLSASRIIRQWRSSLSVRPSTSSREYRE